MLNLVKSPILQPDIQRPVSTSEGWFSYLRIETERLRRYGAPFSIVELIFPIAVRRDRLQYFENILLEMTRLCDFVCIHEGARLWVVLGETQADEAFAFAKRAEALLKGEPEFESGNYRMVVFQPSRHSKAQDVVENIALARDFPSAERICVHSPSPFADEALAISRRTLEEALRKAREEGERAKLKAATKTNFLANMSHEVRSPLNGLLGLAEQLLDTPLSSEQHDVARTIMSSAEFLVQIVNDYLDMEKLETGRLEFEAIDFDLRSLCDEVIKSLGPQRLSEHVKVNLKFDKQISRVKGDPVRTRQIISNLLSNALKFTQHGSVDIRIGRQKRRVSRGVRLAGVGEAFEGGQYVTLQIRDTGIGIAPQTMHHLGEPYRQADSSIARRFGGSGLGLAITKQIVEGMNGFLYVTSEEGKGTEFTVHLPFTAGEPVAASLSAVHANTVASPSPRGRVLVVDDQDINIKVASAALGKFGFDVAIAKDGQSAIKHAQAEPFDLILMDMHMPVLSGFEAARAIRTNEGPNQATPIIAMTGQKLIDEPALYLNQGLNDVLTKPFKRADLEDILVRHIPGWADNSNGRAKPNAASLGEFDPQFWKENFGHLGTQERHLLLSEACRAIVELAARLETTGHQTKLKSALHKLVSLAGNIGFIGFSKRASSVESYIQRHGMTIEMMRECIDLGTQARSLVEEVEQQVVQGAF